MVKGASASLVRAQSSGPVKRLNAQGAHCLGALANLRRQMTRTAVGGQLETTNLSQRQTWRLACTAPKSGKNKRKLRLRDYMRAFFKPSVTCSK